MPKKVYTEEELAELAQYVSGWTGDGKELNEVERYVISRGIKAGEDRVTPAIVYLDYAKWADKPITYLYFTRQLALIFPPQRQPLERYYLLDSSDFDMSRENYWNIRAEMRKARAKNKKKGQGEVPWINPKRKRET